MDAIRCHGQEISRLQRRSRTLSVAELTRDGFIDLEARTIILPVSSDEPCDRGWYREVQLHGEENIDLSRIQSGSAPVLYNHNRDQYLGIIESAYLIDGRLYQKQRFDTHELAEQVWQSILKGVLKSPSIGYRIHEWEEFEDDEGFGLRVIQSEILETSIVTIPADPTVGVGKSIQIFMPAQPVTEPEEKQVTEVATQVDPDMTDVVQLERERQGAINKYREFMGDQWAENAITEGMPVEEVRRQVLEKKDAIVQAPVGIPELGLTKKEEKEYSLAKAIFALADQNVSGLGIEREVHEALLAKGVKAKRNNSLLIPIQDLKFSRLGRRDFQIGDANTGAPLLETQLDAANFIDLLRTIPRVYQMGGRMLTGLVGNLDIPRQGSATTAYWVAEDEDITASDMNFDLVQFRAKVLGILSYATRLMLQQATPDIEQLLRSDMLAVAAREIDRSALMGTGLGNQPLGIVNQPGILSIDNGPNGGAPNWGRIVDMETLIDDADALMGSPAYLFNAVTKGRLKQTVKEAGEARYIWDGDQAVGQAYGIVNGYRAFCSNQVPKNLSKGTGTDLSAAFFANWSDFMTGMWGDFELAVDPFANFPSGRIGYRLFVTLDHQILHPESFAVATDFVTA